MRSFAVRLLMSWYYESKVELDDAKSLIKKVERPECLAKIETEVCQSRNVRDRSEDNW